MCSCTYKCHIKGNFTSTIHIPNDRRAWLSMVNIALKQGIQLEEGPLMGGRTSQAWRWSRSVGLTPAGRRPVAMVTQPPARRPGRGE